MNKEEALQRITDSRQALMRAIQGLEEASFTQAPVEGVWDIKDLLGHIIAWDCAFLRPLKLYLGGGSFEPEAIPDYDVWNACQADQYRKISLQAVLEELDAIRHALLDATLRLSPAQWEERLPAPWGGLETPAEMISGLAWHENYHLKSIQEWRENNKL